MTVTAPIFVDPDNGGDDYRYYWMVGRSRSLRSPFLTVAGPFPCHGPEPYGGVIRRRGCVERWPEAIRFASRAAGVSKLRGLGVVGEALPIDDGARVVADDPRGQAA